VAVYGFLHTAEVHVDVFTDLLAELSPDDTSVHLVDESLLIDARRLGAVDDDLRLRIGTRLQELSSQGAIGVICTCSTIGGPSEDIGPTLDIEVLRVDRPMADLAVVSGTTIAIVAALESTVAPTRALLTEAAVAAGRTVTIVDAPCLEAWTHFEAGDQARYVASLAAHLQTLDDAFDVIVLAQASMAPVQTVVALHSLVLSSPRPAVAALLHL
jgi:hypothetical protein